MGKAGYLVTAVDYILWSLGDWKHTSNSLLDTLLYNKSMLRTLKKSKAKLIRSATSSTKKLENSHSN